MKIGIISLLILFFLGMNSCSGGEKDVLLGEWKLVDIDYSRHLAEINPELKESFLSMTDRQSQIILSKTFFNFKEEGEIVITSPKYQGGVTNISGTWRISEDRDSLYIKNEDSESFAIQLKDDNTLLLESGEAPLRLLTLVRN